MNRKRITNKTALLAAIIAILLMATAVAAVVGNSGFKDKLNAEGAKEVASLVQEVHLEGDDVEDDGFRFSIDEIIWEDRDLYVSYSMSVPEDGRYLVAMYTPTLNGEKLAYDAKGWTSPKFFDSTDDDPTPAALLLGGRHAASCNELWTFDVDPRLKQRTDNRLRFRAVLLKTDLDLVGGGDWTDMLNPPKCVDFDRDWRDRSLQDVGADQAALMDAAADALADGTLTVDELIATGYVEYVSEREITMGLDASKLPEAVFNDVSEHDFDRLGVHIHVDRFHLTHLGVEIECTFTLPDGASADEAAARKLQDIADLDWRFCTVDGESLGYSLGGTGGGGFHRLEDGTPACQISWHESVILPLNGLERIALAPCEYVDNTDDNGNHPVYDMEHAIALTPVYSEDVAEVEANATPEPTLSPEEREMLENSFSA